MFLPVVLAGLTTVAFPMAAVNFQWPALAGCVAALVFTKVDAGARPGLLRWIGVVIAALPVVVVLTPLTEAVWLAIGLERPREVAALVGLVGLVFLQTVPILDTLREPNGWWAPVAGLVLAGIFLAVGMSTARPSADRPAPSTLVYLMDRETGSAYWGTDPTRDDSDPGVAWAAAAVGPFDAGGSGEAMTTTQPAEALRYALAAAVPVDLPPPTVTVVTDSTVVPDVLRVSVTSAIGAELMLFRPGDAGARLAAINGKTVSGRAGSWHMEHWGEPEGGVLLDFDRASVGDGVLSFTVTEHHLRPGELVGNTIFARPDDLAPNTRMLSDRAMIRTTVSVDVGTGAVTFVRATEGGGEGEVEETGEGLAEPSGGEGEEEAATGDSADVVVEDTVAVADTTATTPDTTTPPDTGSVRRR